MEAKIYLEKQIKSMVELQNHVFEGLTNPQLRFLPGGTVSPIGVIWLHMAFAEDSFIAILMGKPTQWESAGWKERFGLEQPPDFGEDWTVYQDSELTFDLLQAYTESIRKRTQACLASTRSETLDERVKFFTDDDPKAVVWNLLVQHSLMHIGEISTIKGLQGVKGLPF